MKCTVTVNWVCSGTFSLLYMPCIFCSAYSVYLLLLSFMIRGCAVVLVRSVLPLRTLHSMDLHVRFCDGREGSIADASELRESGSP